MTGPQGLLDIVSRIEKQIDQSEELGVLLQNADSEYKLIDSKFRAIDRKRWIGLTDADARSIFMRLVRVSKGCRLTVSYSERKFWTDRGLAWDLVSLHIKMENKQKELSEARRSHAPTREVRAVEASLNALRQKYRTTRHRRVAQRFALLAVRYNLIDPGGLLFDENEAYLAEVCSQTWVKRGNNSLSGSLQDSRSRSPGSARIVLPQTRATAGIGPRHTDIRQKVVDQSKASARHRTGKGAAEVAPNIEQVLLSSPIPADKIQARFQAPLRSAPSQSLIPVPERAPGPLKKSRPLDPTRDLEKQTQATREPGKVSFAPHPQGMRETPTFTLPSSMQTNMGNEWRVSNQRRVQSPYIFGQHRALGQATPSGSLTIAPFRLPPLAVETEFVESVRPKKLLSSASSPSTSLDLPKTIETAKTQGGHGGASVPWSADTGTSLLTGPAASRLRAHRKIKDIKHLQPFFQWRGPAATELSKPRVPRPSGLQKEGALLEGSRLADAVHVSGEKLAEDILEILNTEMEDEYLISDHFAIQPHHFEDVEEKTVEQVLSAFDKSFLEILPHSQSKHPTELLKFLETKLSIFLKVDTILSCFVGNNELASVLIRKVWGIVFSICELSLEDVSY